MENKDIPKNEHIHHCKYPTFCYTHFIYPILSWGGRFYSIHIYLHFHLL